MEIGLKRYNFEKVIADERLGLLKLEHAASDTRAEYNALLKLGNEDVKLVLYTNEQNGELTEAIKNARLLVKSERKVKANISKFIEASVVRSLNQSLFKSKPISIESLVQNTSLSIIDVHADGRATFWFESGTFLDGHSLVLYGNILGVINEFDLPG